jgi:hypothetical protein
MREGQLALRGRQPAASTERRAASTVRRTASTVRRAASTARETASTVRRGSQHCEEGCAGYTSCTYLRSCLQISRMQVSTTEASSTVVRF